MSPKKLRRQIDVCDKTILKTLNARAKVSQAIGEMKRRGGDPVYAPDRERELLTKLKGLNSGPVTNASLEAIYREIMSSSLSLEKNLSIAYLGPEYTFTHQASIKKFGQSVRYVPCQTISDIFMEVENGRCDYGVAPVENSTEGAIYHTLDSFVDSDLKICSEVTLKINLDVLSKEKSVQRVKKIYSNPQVFGQCRSWLERYAHHAALLPVTSTARSAKQAAKEKGSACIASRLAARPNGLKVLAPSIQDKASNTTRFMVLSRDWAKPTKSDRTSIVISIKDKAGALQRVLEPFKKNNINLSKIESRPSKKKSWDYYFFIDFDAHMEDARVKRALKSVENECAMLKILGSYPKA
jgi:chorismate mutase/prephenate dehydratase